MKRIIFCSLVVLISISSLASLPVKEPNVRQTDAKAVGKTFLSFFRPMLSGFTNKVFEKIQSLIGRIRLPGKKATEKPRSKRQINSIGQLANLLEQMSTTPPSPTYPNMINPIPGVVDFGSAMLQVIKPMLQAMLQQVFGKLNEIVATYSTYQNQAIGSPQQPQPSQFPQQPQQPLQPQQPQQPLRTVMTPFGMRPMLRHAVPIQTFERLIEKKEKIRD
ncbi:hypothetical protein SNEBB_000337 [Seison nebaliae]|nr:hypothetical protein SNEBB_000337 [Seison nebaliae]